MTRISETVALVLALLLLGSSPIEAATGSTREPRARGFAPGEIVVGYHDGTTRAERLAVRGAVDAAAVRAAPHLDVIELDAGVSVAEGLDAVPPWPQVRYAEPNYVIRAAAEPNDPLYGEAWSLGPTNSTGIRSGIDMPAAWNITVGSEEIAVGVVDSGIDAAHPDLVQNLWTNPGEIGGGRESNGKDDDANGLVDDWRGWDWIDSDNDPGDLNGHGTNVAGTIGAKGNNGVGGSGVSWNNELLALRVLDEEGVGLTSDTASAFSYAGEMGIPIVNASLTASVPSAAMLAAITDAPDTLFVAAAGNNATNNDLVGRYPCNFPLPNVVCVAATNDRNELSSFSNYGLATVDLAAPGERIVTTDPHGYVDFAGTSAAAPHVSGVAAIVASRHPEASATALSDALLAGVEPLPSLQGKTRTGGRLNAANSLRQMGDVVPPDDGDERLSDRHERRGDDGDTETLMRCRKRHKEHGHRHGRRRCRRR